MAKKYRFKLNEASLMVFICLLGIFGWTAFISFGKIIYNLFRGNISSISCVVFGVSCFLVILAVYLISRTDIV